MNGKGHKRRPCLVGDKVLAENWGQTFRPKTKLERDREESLIIAHYTDLYLGYGDESHPEVKAYYKQHQHNRKIRDAMNRVAQLKIQL